MPNGKNYCGKMVIYVHLEKLQVYSRDWFVLLFLRILYYGSMNLSICGSVRWLCLSEIPPIPRARKITNWCFCKNIVCRSNKEKREGEYEESSFWKRRRDQCHFSNSYLVRLSSQVIELYELILFSEHCVRVGLWNKRRKNNLGEFPK
jgi:hypothetical protein